MSNHFQSPLGERSPRVYLVGAGPGNPGLLTLRALECLHRADLIIYDQLVPLVILDHAPSQVERICVSAFPGSRTERWPKIVQAMIEAVQQGKCVVRLKGGDPYLFARGGEEALALHQAGIPFEVVPGVTAALGAAAFAGIPLSHRFHSSAVALITGHEDPEKADTSIDWPALACFPGTLVIYMGMAQLPAIVQKLLAQGKEGNTPAAVVERATTGKQRTVEAPLAEIQKAAAGAGLRSPALIIIGAVVGFRSGLTWFENRPLFGKHVLIARPRSQSSRLAAKLDELGAVTWLLPAVEILDPDDWSPVDNALNNLKRFDWLVFTSVNGVRSALGRLQSIGHDLRVLGHLRIAAIGPATAEALNAYHLRPDLVPAEFRSESLAAELTEHVRGKRILLLRADRGRELLREELAKVAAVEQVAVYRQVDSVDTGSEAFARMCSSEIDYVFLTSSNITRSLLRALGGEGKEGIKSGQVKLVSISPVTTAAIAEFGIKPEVESEVFTEDGMIAALLKSIGAI